eukprot:TRINITY_DN16901_c0_g1_i1.p1 TRINITY_DN16901_c0_g1~~TRINITY_DN16901_c0_g1_i1.p1  ORF type:complete len:381 (+),score=26.58 TRINITY_DN16901_c0_g1_i1:118-1143(+)
MAEPAASRSSGECASPTGPELRFVQSPRPPAPPAAGSAAASPNSEGSQQSSTCSAQGRQQNPVCVQSNGGTKKYRFHVRGHKRCPPKGPQPSQPPLPPLPPPDCSAGGGPGSPRRVAGPGPGDGATGRSSPGAARELQPAPPVSVVEPGRLFTRELTRELTPEPAAVRPPPGAGQPAAAAAETLVQTLGWSFFPEGFVTQPESPRKAAPQQGPQHRGAAAPILAPAALVNVRRLPVSFASKQLQQDVPKHTAPVEPRPVADEVRARVQGVIDWFASSCAHRGCPQPPAGPPGVRSPRRADVARSPAARRLPSPGSPARALLTPGSDCSSTDSEWQPVNSGR